MDASELPGERHSGLTRILESLIANPSILNRESLKIANPESPNQRH